QLLLARQLAVLDLPRQPVEPLLGLLELLLRAALELLRVAPERPRDLLKSPQRPLVVVAVPGVVRLLELLADLLGLDALPALARRAHLALRAPPLRAPPLRAQSLRTPPLGP